MRVLVIGKFHVEAFGLHIAETFAHMGHEVTRFDPAPGISGVHSKFAFRMGQVGRTLRNAAESVPPIRRLLIRSLWAIAEDTAPDMIVVTHDFLWPEEVRRLKKVTKAVVVMWFPDAIINFGRGYFMNSAYDALFFKDPYIVNRLREVLRSDVFFLPEGFNPHRHRIPAELEASLPLDEYACDICTAGNLYTYRVAFFRQLTGFKVQIWGNPPPMWMSVAGIPDMYRGRFLQNERKALAFRSAKIALNNLHPAEIWSINCRAFEIAGVGAFQLVDWRPGISDLFEIGTEIACFRGMKDLREKIDHYLAHPEERDAIAKAGMARAYKHHTYEHRIASLIDTVQGRARGHAMPEIRCRAVAS